MNFLCALFECKDEMTLERKEGRITYREWTCKRCGNVTASSTLEFPPFTITPNEPNGVVLMPESKSRGLRDST